MIREVALAALAALILLAMLPASASSGIVRGPCGWAAIYAYQGKPGNG